MTLHFVSDLQMKIACLGMIPQVYSITIVADDVFGPGILVSATSHQFTQSTNSGKCVAKRFSLDKTTASFCENPRSAQRSVFRKKLEWFEKYFMYFYQTTMFIMRLTKRRHFVLKTT